MADYTIDHNVPMPVGRIERNGLTAVVRALAAEAIGASLFVDGGKTTNVSRAAYYAAGTGWYTCRAVDGGCRIWKTSEPTPKVAEAALDEDDGTDSGNDD